ncbi:hypothetical protein JCM8097_005809 [Rhodosporidiobolus ruineniae]
MASSLFASFPVPASSFSLNGDGVLSFSPSEAQPFSLNGRTPFLSLASSTPSPLKSTEPSFEQWDGAAPALAVAVKPTSTLVRSSSADLDSLKSNSLDADTASLLSVESDSSSVADSEPSSLFDDSFSSSTSSRSSTPELFEFAFLLAASTAVEPECPSAAEPTNSSAAVVPSSSSSSDLIQPVHLLPTWIPLEGYISSLLHPYRHYPSRAVSAASAYTPFFRTPEQVESLAASAWSYVPSC